MASDRSVAVTATPKLRRIPIRRQWAVAVVVCIVVQLTTATRANAWFGWLDRLSGPGPFYSVDFEYRLACFGPTFERGEVLDNLIVTAGAETVNTLKNRENFGLTKKAWSDIAKAVAETNDAFPVLARRDVSGFTQLVETLNVDEVQQLRPNLFAANLGVGEALRLTRINALGALAARFAAGVAKANTAINSTGSMLSFCGPTKTRRWGLELGASLGWAGSNPQYAGNNKIQLVSLVPSVSYRLFADPRHDAIDVGAGVGGYWFSSRGLNALRGIIIHPRVDLHTPSSWANHDGFESWLSLFTLRFGFVFFPGGFDANAFAATNDKAVPIRGGEPIPRASVVVNLQTLIQRWKPQAGFP
jgi:hypothetical protein